MKRLSIIQLFVTVVILVTSNSCQTKQDVVEQQSSWSSKYFYLLDQDFKVIDEINTKLLICVNKDLIKKNRTQDASKLFNTYDINTGKVRQDAYPFFKQVELSTRARYQGKNARTQSTLMTFSSHQQDLGWYNNLPINSGTTWNWYGQNSTSNPNDQRRLEAFIIDADIASAGSQWNDPNSICYNAYVGGANWVGPRSIGQVAGTTGQAKPLRAIWIWIGQTFASNVYFGAIICGKTRNSTYKYDWYGQNGETIGDPNNDSEFISGIAIRLIYFSS